jgi:hypothetical protein
MNVNIRISMVELNGKALNVLCDKKIPMRIKCKFYRSVVRPAMAKV